MIGIYKITNKLNGQCYIGQSINIARRWKEHIQASISKNSRLYIAMRKYTIENFTFEIVEECSEEQLNEKEKYWINYYDSYNNGYNMTQGGESGKKADYKYLVSQYKIYKTTKKTAEACGCNYHTVSNALQFFNIKPNYNGSNGQKRAIKQIDPVSLKVIDVFDSIAEAQKKFNVSSNTAISKALKDKKIAYGYFWLDEMDDISCLQSKQPKTSYKNNKILQIDKNNDIILNEYNNIKEALLFLNKPLNSTNIYRVLKGERKTAYGYRWKLKEDYNEILHKL